MSELEILTHLAAIIGNFTGIPESNVTLEAELADDLDIDSLAMVEIVVSAQDKFGVEIPDKDLMQFRTVQDVVGYLQAYGVRACRPEGTDGRLPLS